MVTDTNEYTDSTDEYEDFESDSEETSSGTGNDLSVKENKGVPNGRLPTLPERDRFQAELLSAAREGREPKYKTILDVMKEGLAEEMIVWGSPSQQLQTKEGRHTTRQHTDKTDADQGLNTVEGTTQLAQTPYDEAVKLEAEADENRRKAAEEARESGAVNVHAYDKVLYVKDAEKTPDEKKANS